MVRFHDGRGEDGKPYWNFFSDMCRHCLAPGCLSGAVGDVLCHFVDENGELIPSDIEDRLISTPLEKLRAMDNVVGLAAGAQKVEAIRAVLRGGYLDVLITDEPTAALLLKGE